MELPTLSEKKCRFHRNHADYLDYPKRYRLKGSDDIQGSIRNLVGPQLRGIEL